MVFKILAILKWGRSTELSYQDFKNVLKRESSKRRLHDGTYHQSVFNSRKGKHTNIEQKLNTEKKKPVLVQNKQNKTTKQYGSFLIAESKSVAVS